MTSGDAEAQLRGFVESEFGHKLNGRALELDFDLLGEGIIDSMGVMQLVSFIEENLGVTVEDEDITPDNFRSVSALTGFVNGKGAGA